MSNRRWRAHQLSVVLALFAACAIAAPAPPIEDGRAASQAAAPAKAAVPTGVQSPTSKDAVRFAVLGDTGTGGSAQYEVGAQLEKARAVFPFDFVIMVGDNMYGSERPRDYVRKFEEPYKTTLAAKIPFYAALGNHDDPSQRLYELFNMKGDRYYTFRKTAPNTPGVRFFALDSTYMNQDQLAWIEQELRSSDSPWKIAFFHHPLYSSGGRHGSEVDLRTALEPLFVEHGVNVVFSGHEHFYERLKPQQGIAYFTAGGSAKLRAGNIRKTNLTAVGYDRDNSFMLVEIAGDVMHFQTLSRTGIRVDGGSISRSAQSSATAPAKQ